MEKKIIQLTEAFQHLRFQECIRSSDQILKKIQKSEGKKKLTLTDQQFRNLYLTRIGSLAATGQLHEANELILQKFKEPVISQQTSFLFLQICSLALDARIPLFITTICQNKQKKNIDINRFMLLSRKFSQLSRIFLRKFASSKKNSDNFTQIYLQYLQQLQNKKMITYKRDRIIRQEKQLDFKFVSMFLDKYIQNFLAQKIPQQHVQISYYNKTKRAIADLKFKIAIHQSNSALVRKYFQQYKRQILQNIFVYLRSLKLMQSQKTQNFIIWKQQFLNIFRDNLNLDNYKPVFSFSIEFIAGIFQAYEGPLTQIGDLKIIPEQQLYIFKENSKQQIENYINSLFVQYQNLRCNQKQNRKKDYYKISLKNCLLLLMHICQSLKKYELCRKFLNEYKQQYGKKLTFPEEIRKYIENLQLFTTQVSQQFRKAPLKIQNDQDKLIWAINYERIFARNPLKYTLQQNYQEWERLYQLYLFNLKDYEKERKLEKGQRYLSDQFLTILADSIRKFTEQVSSEQLTQTQRQQIYFYILNYLQNAISRSPYNHDNKLRTIYFCNKLNYYQQTLKILQSLDIKAVQFQTLGYFYLKNIINFNIWDANEQLLTKMVRSYQQNYRQSSQYAYKALLGISFNQSEQNLCYFDNINRSYNFTLLLYTLYMKNYGKNNNQFYLREILQRIKQSKNRRLTFNADFKVMRNIVDPQGNDFVDLYGILNSYVVLQKVCKVRLLLFKIMKQLSQEQIGELRKQISIEQLNIKQVYDFSAYQFSNKQINYKFTGQKVHHQKVTSAHLRLTNLMNRIILNTCDLIITFKKDANVHEQLYKGIVDLIKQLNDYLCSLSWREQVLFLPSIRYSVSELIPVLVSQVSILSAKKKKIENQAAKKQCCQEIINLLIECVSDGLKIKEKLEIDKKYNTQKFLQRDKLLDRVTRMSSSEYKKLYKLKL